PYPPIKVLPAVEEGRIDHRPSLPGGPARRERNERPRNCLREPPEAGPRTYARSGASVSLVTSPDQTRSHSASTISRGNAPVSRARSEKKSAARRSSRSRTAPESIT